MSYVSSVLVSSVILCPERVGVLADYSPFYDYVNVSVGGGLTSRSPSQYHDDNDHQIMVK